MSYLRRPVVLIALLACCASLALSACGSKSKSSDSSTTANGTSTSTISHPDVKFVANAGIAFGAFHHFIYQPYKAGDLQHPLQHKKATLLAIAAAGVTYNRLKAAIEDAKASPTLSKLVTPLNALLASVTGLAAKVKSGGLSGGSLDSISGAMGTLSGQSASAGSVIKDVVPSAASLL